MADPLKLLREYALDRKPIKEKDDYIIFGDIAFPKDVKTNFRVYGKTSEYYTVESLNFFFQKRELVHTVYVKEAAGKQLQPVTRPDRKDLIEFLTNRHAKQPSSIDVTAPIPPPVLLARQASHHVHSSQDNDFSQPSDAKRPRAELSDADRQKEKERMERILDGGLKHPQKDAGIRGLSDKLTADKIAALKSKVITRKRTLIKSTEEGFGDEPGQGPGLIGLSAAELDALDRDLRARERLWRTRTSCMETSVKNFAKTVFPVLQQLKVREETAAASGSKTLPPPVDLAKKEDPVAKSRAAREPGYSRYDQERFRKEETADLGIDTMGTYHGITLKSITEGAKPKPQINPSAASQENEPSRPHKRVSRTPIIVIPASSTSLITMYNARDLLENYRYVSSDQKKAEGTRRDNEILVHRAKEGGVTVPYRVVDNPLKLTAEEWDRVVAVFVQGPAWQFKGWPWGGVPVDVFSKIAAFHLKFDEMKLDPNVAKWNVTVLTMSRNKRHLDRANLIRFWELLEKYLMKNKPHLRF